MDRRILTACIAVAPLLLGGCTVFHKLGFGHARPVQQASRDNPASLTAKGRTQLDSGNFGLAVEAFQQALGRGEPAAPALNGLGVAYARLGRADLAAQLFRQALAEEPTNGKYAENLALLEQSRAPVAQPVLTARAASAPAPDPQVEGRLVQVAPREFTIRTLRPEIAASGAATTAPKGFRPIIRIALRPPTTAKTPQGKEALR